ncbi:MAG TPA: 30S ribosomal protein S20 [Anaerolineales bacterium]|nr:30S ribosomal protein S20 [Anaerolineales bacterium]
MANIKSQIKRNRQNERRRLRNRDFRGAARTAVKDARVSLENGQETAASVRAALSALDQAAQKGAIHRRNAARRKGRLMKRLAALGLQVPSAAVEPAAPLVEKKEVEKRPAKAEKESRPAKEEKPRAEPKKPATRSVEKKTAEKKPAARSATKKTAEKK